MGERQIVSVANLTRKDGEDFLALAQRIGIRTHINIYSLADANRALDDRTPHPARQSDQFRRLR